MAGPSARVFAGINVLAMIVSGVTTMVSMIKSGKQALSVGDSTAASFYWVGAMGGVMMVAGGISLGVSLMMAGGAASATGVGATIGVVLFTIGGLIAAIAAIVAVFFSSDDYEIFARKCFFGKHGTQEPRFAIISQGSTTEHDPPDWTHALKSGTNTWPIEKQKRAIHNLLGKFDVISRIEKGKKEQPDFQGSIAFEISPGLLMEDCTFEAALHYGKNGPPTSIKFKWLGEKNYQSEWVHKGDIFNDKFASFDIRTRKGYSKSSITLFLINVRYESKKGDLLGTVTLRYPELPNVIRCRKLVMEADDRGQINPDEVTSELFE